MRFLRLLLLASCGPMGLATLVADDLNGLLIDGEEWQEIAGGYGFTEGPAVDLAGRLYFTDTFASKIHRIDDNGQPEMFADNTARTNGLMFGRMHNPEHILFEVAKMAKNGSLHLMDRARPKPLPSTFKATTLSSRGTEASTLLIRQANKFGSLHQASRPGLLTPGWNTPTD